MQNHKNKVAVSTHVYPQCQMIKKLFAIFQENSYGSLEKFYLPGEQNTPRTKEFWNLRLKLNFAAGLLVPIKSKV